MSNNRIVYSGLVTVSVIVLNTDVKHDAIQRGAPIKHETPFFPLHARCYFRPNSVINRWTRYFFSKLFSSAIERLTFPRRDSAASVPPIFPRGYVIYDFGCKRDMVVTETATHIFRKYLSDLTANNGNNNSRNTEERGGPHSHVIYFTRIAHTD